jgi:hypothetical protein
MANVPLILVGLGLGGLVYYSVKRKPAAALTTEPPPDLVAAKPVTSGVFPQEPVPHPDLPPAPTPEPPPKEPPPAGPGVEGEPWSPPPKEPEVPACKQMAKIHEDAATAIPVVWTQRGSRNITLLNPSNECNSYKIAVGVCIQPVDYQLDPNVVLISDEIKAAFVDKEGQFSHDINWNQFKAPVWKGIFESTVHYPIQGNLLLMKSEQPAMVPKTCKNLQGNWPVPKGKFLVHASDDSWKTWDPTPKLSLEISGKVVSLHVEFSGFPVFKDGLARLDKTSTVKITYKTWSIGI